MCWNDKLLYLVAEVILSIVQSADQNLISHPPEYGAGCDAYAAIYAFVPVDDRRGRTDLFDGALRASGNGGAAVVLGAQFRLDDDHNHPSSFTCKCDGLPDYFPAGRTHCPAAPHCEAVPVAIPRMICPAKPARASNANAVSTMRLALDIAVSVATTGPARTARSTNA